MSAFGLSPDRVVEILARLDGRKEQATGYRVSEHLVITVRHAIVLDGERAREVWVRFGGHGEGGTFEAHPVWISRAPYGDLAVLQLQANTQPLPASTRVRIAKVTASHPPGLPCVIAGFPRRMQREHPSGKGRFREMTIESTVTTVNVKRGLLEIPLSGRQVDDLDEWVGVSGAPVFVNDALVGIIVKLERQKQMLLAAQIGVATGDISVTIPGCSEPEASASELRQRLAPEKGTLDIAPAYRRAAYRDRVETIAARCASLLGRDRELAALRRLTEQRTPYILWTGLPWSGKTALAAAFASQPGAGLDVVAFFASRAEGQQEDELWDAVADQLAALSHQAPPNNPRSEFDRLWTRAYQTAKAEDRTVILLIDGLDELDEGPSGEPIGPRLPTSVPGTARVVLLGRPNPRITELVSPDHPLRNPALVRYDLEPSPYALRIGERAEGDLTRLLVSNDRLPRLVLGMITMTGPLGAPDAAHLLRVQGVDADSGDVKRVFLRALSGRVLVQADYTDEERYAFAHDTLRAAVAEKADPDSLARHRQALLQWGDEHHARNWSGKVPRCLIDEYGRALIRANDRERLMALLTSRERVALLRQRTGSDRRALEDIRQGLALLAQPDADGLEAAVRAALTVDAMRRGDDDPPLDLVLAYARIGAWPQAEHLAHLAEGLSGVTALIAVAELALASDHKAKCWSLAEAACLRLGRIDWVDLEAAREHPAAFRPPGRRDDDVPLKHMAMAGLMGRLSILAEHLQKFAKSRALTARIWTHVHHVTEIGDEAFGYLSWAALAGALAGDDDETRALLVRMHASALPADAGSLLRAARAGEVVGMRQVHAEFVDAAIARATTAEKVVDIAEEFWARGDFATARWVLERAIGVADAHATQSRSKSLLARIGRMTPDLVAPVLVSSRPTVTADQVLAEAESLTTEPTSILFTNPHDDKLVSAAEMFVDAGLPAEAAKLIGQLSSPAYMTLDFYESSITGMALRAAKAGEATEIDQLLAAAESYIRRRRIVNTSTEWVAQFQALADIVVAASSHERIHDNVASRIRHLQPEQRGQVLSAIALGAGKAGDVKWAMSLLEGQLGWPAVKELAKFLAPTYFWPYAMMLVTSLRNSSYEQCEVAWQAIGPAIRTGDLDTAVKVLDSYPANRFLPDREKLLIHAVELSAQTGSDVFVQHFLTLITGRGAFARALAGVALEAAKRDSGMDARAYCQQAVAHARKLPLPRDRSSALGTIAAAAFILGDNDVTTWALRSAMRSARLVRPHLRQAELLIELAETLREAGNKPAAGTVFAEAEAAAAAARISTNETRLDQLADIACGSYKCGDHESARRIVDRLLAYKGDTDNLMPGARYVAAAAAMAGDHATARRLLTYILSDARRRPLLPGHLRSASASLAETAATAGEWGIAEDIAHIAHPTALPEVLSTLAVAASQSAPEKSRRWLAQGLADHISPAVLAAACTLDNKVGPLALDEVLDRIGALSPSH
jgi:Trypsin